MSNVKWLFVQHKTGRISKVAHAIYSAKKGTIISGSCAQSYEPHAIAPGIPSDSQKCRRCERVLASNADFVARVLDGASRCL